MSWLKKKSIKEFAVCAATANLYFLSAWRTFLVPARQYHLALPPNPVDFAVLGCDILLISLVMYALLVLVRRRLGEFASNVLTVSYVMLLLIVFVNAYRPDISDAVFGLTHPFRMRVALTLLVGGLVPLMLRKKPAAVARGFHSLGLVVLPCLFLTTFRAAESVLVPHVQSGSAVYPGAANIPGTARTALIIFDMLDYEVLFNERVVPTPEFDRLRNDSFFAKKAMSSSEWTLTSIPTLTTGRIVTDALPVSNDDLVLSFKDSPQKESWRLLPTIFSEARADGAATGLVGWYHPYCRLFGSSLNYCEWVPHMERFDDRSPTFAGVQRAVAEAAAVDMMGPHPPGIIGETLAIEPTLRRKYIQSYQRLLAASMHALTDSSLGFVVVHMPVPHTPSIYDRKTQQFSTREGDYLDNVALADRTMGELRRAMEEAGTWNTTNIVVTADHGYRDTVRPSWPHTQAPYHVPFFVRMSGVTSHIEDDQPFLTVRVHDLLLALLEKKVITPEQARELIHSSRPVSYISQARN